jgi:RNA polymerase sigma-70 factor, ECF subfamily
MTTEDPSSQAGATMQTVATSGTSSRDRFEAVFEAEFSYVWTSLRRLGVYERDAEDVAHELFLEVFRRFAHYDPTRPIRPWLFAFAFRFASDYRRLSRHRVEVLAEHEAEEPFPPADEVLIAKDAQRMILAALEKIDVDRRAVFILHELDECPMSEIAKTLSLPVNTAYSRLRLARAEFQQAIGRLTKTEAPR